LLTLFDIQKGLKKGDYEPNETSAKYCEARAELQVRGVSRAAGDVQRERRTMRGGLVVGAQIVCDAMSCARAGCIRAVRCDAQDVMQ